MENYSKEELLEARRAIASTNAKMEKVLLKLREGTPQHTLATRRLAAFRIAVDLIDRELEE